MIDRKSDPSVLWRDQGRPCGFQGCPFQVSVLCSEIGIDRELTGNEQGILSAIYRKICLKQNVCIDFMSKCNFPLPTFQSPNFKFNFNKKQ